MSKLFAIFLPPLPAISGGFTVLLELGDLLTRLGHKVCFVSHEEARPIPIYDVVRQKTCLPLVSWSQVRLSKNDVWIVPEGWPNALILGLKAEARCIVYMQSWLYALRTLPQGVQWQQLPVDFLCVSEPVRHCLRALTGKDGPLLRPAVDTTLFHPNASINLGAPSHGTVRVAWMPRKNKGIATQIIQAFEQRMARLYPHISVEWVEIQKMSLAEVAATLRSCHIFLCTAFPEGFGLPPLEAMACACVPVGFSGLGGWDYMRSCALPDADMSFLSKPFFAMAPCPVDAFITDKTEGNGFFVEDGHVFAAILALEQATLLVYEGGEALARLRHAMLCTAEAYTAQKRWESFQQLEPFFTA